MYLPRSFRVDELPELQGFMQQHSFATLVSTDQGAITATHLPIELDRKRGPYGTLVAHLARANTQWRDFANGNEVLAMFQGPHAYVSPIWYEPVEEHVPTWNYTAVHAYGVPQIIEDPVRMREILEEMVRTYERLGKTGWQMHNSDAYFEKRMQAIVMFELPITRLEGKYKLSQNRSLNDQTQVAHALSERPLEDEQALGKLMLKRLEQH